MKKTLNVEVGKRIRAARERAHMTREAFSEQIDVSCRFISDVERGSVGISTATLKKICEVLHISSDSLLWEKTTRTSLDEKLVLVDEAYIGAIDRMVQTQLELIELIEHKEAARLKSLS